MLFPSRSRFDGLLDELRLVGLRFDGLRFAGLLVLGLFTPSMAKAPTLERGRRPSASLLQSAAIDLNLPFGFLSRREWGQEKGGRRKGGLVTQCALKSNIQ